MESRNACRFFFFNAPSPNIKHLVCLFVHRSHHLMRAMLVLCFPCWWSGPQPLLTWPSERGSAEESCSFQEASWVGSLANHREFSLWSWATHRPSQLGFKIKDSATPPKPEGQEGPSRAQDLAETMVPPFWVSSAVLLARGPTSNEDKTRSKINTVSRLKAQNKKLQ